MSRFVPVRYQLPAGLTLQNFALCVMGRVGQMARGSTKLMLLWILHKKQSNSFAGSSMRSKNLFMFAIVGGYVTVGSVNSLGTVGRRLWYIQYMYSLPWWHVYHSKFRKQLPVLWINWIGVQEGSKKKFGWWWYTRLNETHGNGDIFRMVRVCRLCKRLW